MEERNGLYQRNKESNGERMESVREERNIKEEDKEQINYLKEWAKKHPKDGKQGWVAHLFQRFLKKG